MNWKKTISASILTAGLVLGALGPHVSAKTPASDTSDYLTLTSETFGHGQGGPFDIGLVNDEKLMDALTRRGVIEENASYETKQKALQEYLLKRAQNAAERSKSEKSPFSIAFKPHTTKNDGQTKSKGKDIFSSNGALKGHKFGWKNKLDPIQREPWNGETREDKVLVLLIDFPDYPHSDLPSRDGNDPNITLKLPSYEKEHYQNMLFGENGYEGPSGEKLISFKQFYEQQSGGSYTVDGTVAGWYTAKHPAAYYGGNDGGDGNDHNPRALIYEALQDAAQDPNVNLNDYDIEDPNDWDGDGNTREPDGVIDHLMVIHSGIGEEAGGGSLGGDAIWSHSWNLGGLVPIPGSHSDTTKERFGVDALLGYAYTVQPEDGAAGVFSHEYGHNLGLPDEYDTLYTADSVGAATEYWTIMAAGSWAGKIPGTEPTGFGAYDKAFLQSEMPGSNWLHGTEVNFSDLDKDGVYVTLDEASVKGTNTDAVRINLPDKETPINTPASGQFEYWGGNGDEIDHKMMTTVDLTGATSASLDYDVWYNTEENWDFGMVQVSDDGGKTWTSLSTAHTTSDIDANGYPAIKENLPGYTGSSNGWIHETIDLSQYAGKTIQLQFRYMTDWATHLDGIFFDNIKVTKNGTTVLNDDAEGDSAFTLDGFSQSNGKKYTEQYYLLEWRNYADADEALAHIRRGASLMTYDPGLVIWYVDNSYNDNWVGYHPGDGFLGVVDAHQTPAYWNVGGQSILASTRYQIQDAAFSLDKTDAMFLDYRPLGYDQTLSMKKQNPVPLFDDSLDYSNAPQIYAGRNVPKLGLKIQVVAESHDKSVGAIHIYK